jgi:hypothetical protein
MSEEMNHVTDVAQEQDSTEEINVLTGELLTAQQRQRVFGNINALADYVKTFGILGGQFGISTNTGKSIYVLIYNAVN